MKIKEVIPFEYSEVYSFSEGLALVYNDGKHGFIDKTGTMKISCNKFRARPDICYPFYHSGMGFKEGLAVVSTVGGRHIKFGYIDKFGNEVITPKYDAVRDFSCGLAVVGFADNSLGCDSYGASACKWGFIGIDVT